MNTPRALLLVLVAAVVFSLATAAKANLIVNGGFETGDFSGWTLSGNTVNAFVAGTFDGIAPHSGNFQAIFGPAGSPGFLSQTLATTPQQFYQISFALANEGGTPSFFSLIWNNVTIFSLTNPSAFPYIVFNFNVRATSASTQLRFAFRNDPTFFHLDDVSVNQIAPPVPDTGSTFSLLGFALLGLIALRRKLSW